MSELKSPVKRGAKNCLLIGLAIILVYGVGFVCYQTYKWMNAPTSSLSPIFLDELPRYLATEGNELDVVNWHDFHQWVHDQGKGVPPYVDQARFNYEVKRRPAAEVDEAAGRGEWLVHYKNETSKEAVHTEKTAERELNSRIQSVRNE